MVNVIEMLLNTVEEKGDFVAVKDTCKELTYRQLLANAYNLSQEITEIIPGKNRLVLIVTTKSVESITAIWSVVCSGDYYVSLDSKTPVDRFCKILQKIKPDLILYTSENQQDNLPTDILSLTVSSDNKECMKVSAVRQMIQKHHVINQDPLYMVFTSGSTGEPKAIIKSHQSIIAFAESFTSTFGLSSENHEVLGNQASFDFDVAAKDIYISAYIGATLCLIPSNCFLVPSKLPIYLQDNEITILIWAASAVKFVKKFDCFKSIKPHLIKKVFFSGESMPIQCVDYWKSCLPEVTLVNLYAPSEVTGNCLYHIATDEKYANILPLNSVFSNVEVLVLDEDNRPIKDGEKGEIYVRGCFLAHGYYNDIEQTQQWFVQNPLHNLYPDIVYKTGDYVVKKDNYFYFAGRVDNQIKHMGHRIELEEIEASCCAILHCENVCTIYDSVKEKIILLTDDTVGLSYEELVTKLKPIIPKYMIPHELVNIEKLPLNSRGKIDRSAVKNIYEEHSCNSEITPIE